MPIPSIASTPTLDELANSAPPTPGVAAPIGFFDRVSLGMQQKRADADWGFNQMDWQSQALGEIHDALRKRGIEPVDVMKTTDPLPGETGAQLNERHWRELFGQIAQVRQQDQGFLPDYTSVVDRSSFDALIRDRRNKSLADVQSQAPDGLGAGGFIGGLVEGFKDPLSWLPIGGPEAEATSSIGGRILRQALTGAAINAGTTTVLEPLVRADAAGLGQKRTTGDFITDLLTSAAAGSILGASAEGLHIGAGKAVDVLQRRADRKAALTGTPFDSFDADVAKTFAAIVPEDQRTPDEQAAIHAIERDAEVKATSPFVPGPEGDDAHVAHLDQAMGAIHNPETLPQRGTVKPIDRATITGPDDVEGTRMPQRELLKAKIHAVEAPHGGPNLAGGNALGPYQFEPRTWVNLFKRRYPKDARSFDQIAALREDPHLNDVLMNDLISENAAALRHAGFDESAGNLYLAHVLGHDRAVTVLRAAADAKLGDLLPEGYFKHNPFKPTDNAASLVHWAYGKMGDKSGMPAHIAAAPDAPEGAATIEAATTPETAIPTGRFDVEALYGDVGMTDRPVLNPDHFNSPEDHAAAQLRFERASDAADGFAPVMSREEAFAPAEHFDALRRYRGTVTADAIGEALGLNPGEVQRAVGSMQSVDPNSPFILTRGRQPRFGADGTVLREGTEPGRVIRRPPKPIKQNETMLEYLTRTGGGLNDVSGDLASMGAQHWHENAPFRRKLIDNEAGQSLDTAFERAIDAGYFPEHTGQRLGGNDAPDLQDFRDAIDDELRGKPRYAVDNVLDVHEAARRAEVDPEEEATFHAAAEQHFAPRHMTDEEWAQATHGDDSARPFLESEADKRGLEGVGDDVLADVYQRVVDGQSLDDAFADAVAASAARDLEDYAALTGEIGYEPSDDASTFIGEHPEVRGSDGAGGEDGEGGGRSTAAAGGAEESRAELAELAHDPEAGHFNDPVGHAADDQADSVIHDLHMSEQAAGAPIDAAAFDEDPVAAIAALPQEQFEKLGEALGVKRKYVEMKLATRFMDNQKIADVREAYLKVANERVARESELYRLDEEGGESDLADILKEIDDAQKATDEMRNCLKPKGGEE